MSILQQSISVGVETTYGTAVPTTRSYEATADGFSRDIEQVESDGLRAGRHALLSARRRVIDLGATGSLEIPITKTGMGLLLQGTLGTKAITQAGSTTAYTQVFNTDVDQADESYTIEVVRYDSTNTARGFVYSGGTITGGNFAISQGGAATARLDISCQGEDIKTSPTAPVYGGTTDTDIFIYSDARLLVNGVTTASITDFSFDFDLGLDTDRRFLRASARRARPLRNGSPSFSGTLSAEFENLDLYNLFKDGTTFEIEVIMEIADETIATDSGTDYKPTFAIKMPACRFDGSTPSAGVNELTSIELPYVALWNQTDPAATITYISTDDAH